MKDEVYESKTSEFKSIYMYLLPDLFFNLTKVDSYTEGKEEENHESLWGFSLLKIEYQRTISRHDLLPVIFYLIIFHTTLIKLIL